MVVYLVLCLPRFIVLLCFSCIFTFDFVGTSQEIGWERRLRYDLFSVERDVKP